MDFFLHTVMKALHEEAEQVLRQLGDTPASNFEQYHGRVEYRKGLLRAIQLLKIESEK